MTDPSGDSPYFLRCFRIDCCSLDLYWFRWLELGKHLEFENKLRKCLFQPVKNPIAHQRKY